MISVVCLRCYPAVGGVETTVLEITNRLAKSFPMKVITSDLKVENPFQRLSEKERLSEYMNVPIIHLESKKFLPVHLHGSQVPSTLDIRRSISTGSPGFFSKKCNSRTAVGVSCA